MLQQQALRREKRKLDDRNNFSTKQYPNVKCTVKSANDIEAVRVVKTFYQYFAR